MMRIVWAISEVLEFPVFCKVKEYEATETQYKQISPASEGDR